MLLPYETNRFSRFHIVKAKRAEQAKQKRIKAQ